MGSGAEYETWLKTGYESVTEIALRDASDRAGCHTGGVKCEGAEGVHGAVQSSTGRDSIINGS